MLEKKENIYMELNNNINNLNDNNDAHLSNAKILEAIVKFMIKDEEESITGANNVTADAFTHVLSSQRDNSDTIFTHEKLDESENLVNAINNLTINTSGYELNKAITSDSQVNLTSNPDTVTHKSNGPDTVSQTRSGIWNEKLFSCRTIIKVSALPLP